MQDDKNGKKKRSGRTGKSGEGITVIKKGKDSSAPEWTEKLDDDGKGRIRNSLQNLLIILENDEKLKGNAYNQQSDRIEVKGDAPWKRPKNCPYWRDADSAQLVIYIDKNYATFSRHYYELALAKVADDRSFHPIGDYLTSIPDWDGVHRVDTLLIDYLGAEDNSYVRAVTRKTLCAAVWRIFNPGCKFDSMLVLDGPQGIGKSSLISKLGGPWFSDSLSLNDTKDKTAAEKLQGYWIIEIGELAGMRKTEVETLRSFLSRQNDIYRAAFGRRTIPHPRQCIFIGTTNAEEGYLRDTTGNRRFWPVRVPGSAAKHPWELTDRDVEQIWAEALVLSREEKLFLEDDVLVYAVAQQREALESDEREGIVKQYLEMPLPKGWDNLSVYDRQCYFNGVVTPGNRLCGTGTKPRTTVSNMEIWCECFGKDRADLTAAEGNKIKAILIKLGWQRREKKIRIPLYGSQWVYGKDSGTETGTETGTEISG